MNTSISTPSVLIVTKGDAHPMKPSVQSISCSISAQSAASKKYNATAIAASVGISIMMNAIMQSVLNIFCLIFSFTFHVYRLTPFSLSANNAQASVSSGFILCISQIVTDVFTKAASCTT